MDRRLHTDTRADENFTEYRVVTDQANEQKTTL